MPIISVIVLFISLKFNSSSFSSQATHFPQPIYLHSSYHF
jgi:hypothetical protein